MAQKQAGRVGYAMTPDRHEQIRAIFLQAIAVPSSDRQEFLRQACAGDQSIFAEVGRLLVHHNEGTRAREHSTGQPKEDPQHAVRQGLSAPEAPPLTAGTLIANRYRIMAPLGRGGMGAVYRAEDLTLKQEIAIKFIADPLVRNSRWISRFREEVRIARSVTHPGVCRVFDIGQDGDKVFLTMEYVEGEDLACLLRRVGRLTQEKAFQLGREICIGLHAAHRAGVVHRDLKPGNIIIDGDGRARITDFGLAFVPGQAGSADVHGGTPAYMAPEQLIGLGVTSATDIYALGLVLYELFSGEPAFAFAASGDSQEAALPEPARPQTSLDGLPAGLSHVIAKCMSPSPDQRPASALLVAAEIPGGDILAAAVELGEVPPPKLIALANVRKVARRHLTLLAAAAVGMLVLLVWVKARSSIPWDQAGSVPPAVLVDRSARLLASLDRQSPRFRASGFCGSLDLNDAVSAAFGGRRDYHFDRGAAPFFWIRTAPSSLTPVRYENVLLNWDRTTILDPPPIPGSTTIAYDRNGRLVFFHEGPGTPSNVSTSPTSDVPSSWKTLLDAAALAGEPDAAQGPSGDGLQEFSRRGPHKDRTITVQAEGNSIVNFAVTSAPPPRELAMPYASWRKRINEGATWCLFLGLMITCMPGAWKIYRMGQADFHGALRLGLCVFCILVAVRILRLPTTINFGELLRRLGVSLFFAAGAGALLAAFYLALEGHARKYWPDKLVTWSRLLDLRGGDATVREHVLAGTALGVFWAFLTTLERQTAALLNLPVEEQFGVHRIAERLLGLRSLAAGILDIAPRAVLYALLFMLLLVVARKLMGSRRGAVVVALTVLLVFLVPRGAHPYTSLVFWGAGGAALCVWAMMRLGLLTLAVALFFAALLNTTPMTLDITSWHADSMLVVLGLTALAIAYGLWGAGSRVAATSGYSFS